MNITNIRFISPEGDKVKLTSTQLGQVAKLIRRRLRLKGYHAQVDVINSSRIDIRGGIRLTDAFKEEFGRNVSGYSGRRTSNLGWENYLVVNEQINDLLDKLSLSANVTSLKGKFVIRKGTQAFTQVDWDNAKWDNVGSFFNPVYRAEQNENENGYTYADFKDFEDPTVFYETVTGLI